MIEYLEGFAEDLSRKVNKIKGYNLAFYNVLEKAFATSQVRDYQVKLVQSAIESKNGAYSTGAYKQYIRNYQIRSTGQGSYIIDMEIPSYLWILYNGVPPWTENEESPFLQYYDSKVSHIKRLTYRNEYQYDYLSDLFEFWNDSTARAQDIANVLRTDPDFKDLIEVTNNKVEIQL